MKGHTVLWKTHTPTEAMFIEPLDLADLERAVRAHREPRLRAEAAQGDR